MPNLPEMTAEDMPSISELREDGVDEIVDPYRKQINDTPELLSLLYDIDLLPEQIVYRVNAVRMVAFCLVYQKITAAHQRRRLEGLEEAAKIADDYASNADDECVGAVSACGDVAQAIRYRITEGK